MERIWVAPPEPSLLARLHGAPVVLRLNDGHRVGTAVQLAGDAGVDLRCLQIRSTVAVTAHRPDDAWRAAPIVLHARRMGPLRDFLRMRPALAGLELRVFLPGSSENLRALRIAASLGVAGGVEFGDAVDWTALADLATYALLGLVPHAPISPFAEIAERYVPTGRTDFGHVYFDDPTRYLHLDREGRVALGAADLAAGRFLAGSLEDLVPEDHPAYRERLEGWRTLFLEPDGCAWCPGFRVCLGRLRGRGEGCGAFCEELMEVVERRQGRKERASRRWQP